MEFIKNLTSHDDGALVDLQDNGLRFCVRSSSSKPVIRWGIASAGLISHDFICGLRNDDQGHHEVGAIGARDLGRAQQLAKQFSVQKAYGSYEELAQDPDIDAVYIGSIPYTHGDIAKLMIAANKPVLIEKPCATNYAKTKDLLDFAKSKDVLCMEGMWSRFFPASEKVLEVLASGEVGEPLIINFLMGFDYTTMHDMAWRMKAETGGGMAWAFGCYAVSLALSIFKEQPEKIVAAGNMHEDGCDQTSSFVAQYSGGRSLVCTVSAESLLENVAIIHCTKGIIKMDRPWCPDNVKVKDEFLTFPLREPKVKVNFSNATGFLYEADHMRDLIIKGAKESPVMPHQASLDIIRTVDDIRKQLGVVFRDD